MSFVPIGTKLNHALRGFLFCKKKQKATKPYQENKISYQRFYFLLKPLFCHERLNCQRFFCISQKISFEKFLRICQKNIDDLKRPKNGNQQNKKTFHFFVLPTSKKKKKEFILRTLLVDLVLY